MDSMEELPSIELSVEEKSQSPTPSGEEESLGSDDESVASNVSSVESDVDDSDGESVGVDEEGELTAMQPSEEEGSDVNTASPIDELVNGVQYDDSDDGSDDDSDEDDDDEFKKFDDSLRTNIIEEYHKELRQINYDEISALTKVIRDENGNVIDSIHRTLPFLTKFERARVLGVRAKQINDGAEPLVEIPDYVFEGHIIAEKELEAKVIPFIISRPLPNGKKEYWKLQDLELIDY